jgi:hypothetical protein
MSTLADLANPEYEAFSEKALREHCKEKAARIQNSVARKDPKQDFWDALYEDRENFKNYKVNGKTVDEIIWNL